MDEALRRHCLQAMGVEVWELRQPGKETPREDESANKPGDNPLDDTDSPDELQAKGNISGKEQQREEPPNWLDEIPPPEGERLPSLDLNENLLPAGCNTVVTLNWEALQQRVSECTACTLHKSRNNTVFGVGDQRARLMVIGEAPGAEEDRQGEPFVGRAGKLLDAMLLAIGLQRSQVFIANILKCRPPDNRDPRPDEALKCEPFLQRQVALVEPEVILAVGRVAAQNLLKSQEAVGRMRGHEHRFQGIPVVVSYHPAYLLRSPEQKEKSWQDLQRVAKVLRA